MEEEVTAPIIAAKSLISIPTSQFWTVIIALFGFGGLFWQTTITKIAVLENKISSGDQDKGRIENKIDKLSINFFDLNDKVTQIKAILDVEPIRK